MVSGSIEAVAAFGKRLADSGTAARELKTSHAFHSSMMDPILVEFENEVRRVPRLLPNITIFSSLYGRKVTGEEWIDPAYWSGQLRRTVRFAEALGGLLAQENLALLEVGPGQTLSSLARQHSAKLPGQVIAHSCSRTPEETDRSALLQATGQLWAVGVNFKWTAPPDDSPRKRVILPTYPFERKRYWIEPRQAAVLAPAQAAPPEKMESVSNGNHEQTSPATSTDVEALIEEQLRIMARQIEVLRHPSRSAQAREASRS